MGNRTTEWVSTSPIDFKDAETRKLHQAAFRVLPSPYSTPVALRATSFDGESRRVLELTYLGSEPTVKGTYSGGAEIEYGRKTLRPRSISVPMNASANITEFISKIDSALDSFLRVHATSTERHVGPLDEDRLKMTLSFIRSAMRRYQAELKLFEEDS